MRELNVNIHFENITKKILKDVLHKSFGLLFDKNPQKFYFGLIFSVYDNACGYESVANFRKEMGLKDDDSWPSDLDPLNFGILLDIDAYDKTAGFSYIDVVGDALARQLSIDLETRTILSLGENEIPLIVYDNGEILYKFSEEYSKFFKNRLWVPTFLSADKLL